MKRKFAELKNQGVDLELSIALMWTNLTQGQKELLSFNQLRWVMKHTPTGSIEKNESSKILEDKTQSFKKFQSFFEVTSVDSYKVIYIWKKLKEKDKDMKEIENLWNLFSFKDVESETGQGLGDVFRSKENILEEIRFFFTNYTEENTSKVDIFLKEFEDKVATFKLFEWAISSSFKDEPGDSLDWKVFKEGLKDVSFEEIKWLWNNLRLESLKKGDVWPILKTKTKEFKKLKHLWKELPLSSPEREEVWELIDAENRTFEEIYWLHQNLLSGSEQKDYLWMLLKKKATSLMNLKWLREKMYLDGTKKAEIWQLFKENSKSFKKLKWIWSNLSLNKEEAAQIWELLKNNTQSPQQAKWLWTIAPSNSPEKEDAWGIMKKFYNV